jgi:hypothetical protein
MDYTDNGDAGGLPTIDYDEKKQDDTQSHNGTFTYQMAETIMKYVSFNGGFILPFSKIDGIECVGVMEIDSENKYYELTIRAKFKRLHLFSGIVRNDDGVTDVEKMTKSMIGMLNGLKTLRYSSVINRFIPTDIKTMSYNILVGRNDAITAFTNGMKDADNIKLDLNECSVCLNLTTNMLPCFHNLCLLCETKLPKFNCPMCRKKYSRSDCECDGCCDDASLEDVDE